MALNQGMFINNNFFDFRPPISKFLKFLKFLKKLNFSMVIGNGTVIFSERSSFRKANNFKNLTLF